jgi:hypothetical protein
VYSALGTFYCMCTHIKIHYSVWLYLHSFFTEFRIQCLKRQNQNFKPWHFSRRKSEFEMLFRYVYAFTVKNDNVLLCEWIIFSVCGLVWTSDVVVVGWADSRGCPGPGGPNDHTDKAHHTSPAPGLRQRLVYTTDI